MCPWCDLACFVIILHFFSEGALVGNSDTDRQLLEASKSGDLEVVKVCSVWLCLCVCVCVLRCVWVCVCGCAQVCVWVSLHACITIVV